ncbi:MAG: Ppx/GppA phosphatase family protein [Betaproteobacteria bacterium]|nr:Ppx/GppA phosphatase family protein [Betaproteobacteria bacterium]
MSPSVVAAVDLGSNSFRLQVAKVVQGQPYTLDTLKESVRLASGLLPDRSLDSQAKARALACLRRFGERLRGVPRESVRVVGTNTLRIARHVEDFIQAAEAALGVPIEIIAGQEEARLIFVGVGHTLPRVSGRRLVVDIGGGSTEIIIGRGIKPQRMESLYMGCVGYTQQFFSQGRVTERAWKAAELAASDELQALPATFGSGQWDHAVGSSGTARALADLLELNGFPGQGITRPGLEFLKQKLLQVKDPLELMEIGMKADRAPVLPGGLVIMCAVFEHLGIERMETTDCGLREGVLYEMLGRLEHQDIREDTVRHFAQRYHVDGQQVLRVEKLALACYRQLTDRVGFAQHAHFLRWASHLHEIGLSIAHGGYHRHSAYIVDNADMPGFSRLEQGVVASLVQSHRGRLSKSSGRITTREGWKMVLCLRLAVLFNRGRSNPRPALKIKLAECGLGFQIQLSSRWLEQHSLAKANLEREAQQWGEQGMSLEIVKMGS